MKSYSLEVGDMAMKSTCLNMTIVSFADLVQFLCHFQIFSESISQLISSHLEFIVVVLCFYWRFLLLGCLWVSLSHIVCGSLSFKGGSIIRTCCPAVRRSEMVHPCVTCWTLVRPRVCWVSQCTLGDLSLCGLCRICWGLRDTARFFELSILWVLKYDILLKYFAAK